MEYDLIYGVNIDGFKEVLSDHYISINTVIGKSKKISLDTRRNFHDAIREQIDDKGSLFLADVKVVTADHLSDSSQYFPFRNIKHLFTQAWDFGTLPKERSENQAENIHDQGKLETYFHSGTLNEIITQNVNFSGRQAYVGIEGRIDEAIKQEKANKFVIEKIFTINHSKSNMKGMSLQNVILYREVNDLKELLDDIEIELEYKIGNALLS